MSEPVGRNINPAQRLEMLDARRLEVREDSGKTFIAPFRNGERRTFVQEVSERDGQQNRRTLAFVLDYIQRHTGEAVRDQVMNGHIKLEGEETYYTVQEHLALPTIGWATSELGERLDAFPSLHSLALGILDPKQIEALASHDTIDGMLMELLAMYAPSLDGQVRSEMAIVLKLLDAIAEVRSRIIARMGISPEERKLLEQLKEHTEQARRALQRVAKHDEENEKLTRLVQAIGQAIDDMQRKVPQA